MKRLRRAHKAQGFRPNALNIFGSVQKAWKS